MSGILPILIIIFIISQLGRRTKQVKANRPGQTGAAPAPGPARVRRPYVPAQPAVKPSYAPQEPASPQPAEYPDGMLDDSDRARADLSEGESRECDHGSLGGSMDITSHMGQGEEYERAQVMVKAKPIRAAEPQQETAPLCSITKLNAAEMRQAVIMAEILKRPADRVPGRRWAAR